MAEDDIELLYEDDHEEEDQDLNVAERAVQEDKPTADEPAADQPAEARTASTEDEPRPRSPIAIAPTSTASTRPSIAKDTDREQAVLPPVKKNVVASKLGTKYFIIRSYCMENVDISLVEAAWSTTKRNEPKLNNAFSTAPEVRLLFSVNNSCAFQGYAVMKSKTGQLGRPVLWSGGLAFGSPFAVEWKCHVTLPSTEVRGLNNPLNLGQNVLKATDGQELPQDVGDQIVEMLERKAKATGVTAPVPQPRSKTSQPSSVVHPQAGGRGAQATHGNRGGMQGGAGQFGGRGRGRPTRSNEMDDGSMGGGVHATMRQMGMMPGGMEAMMGMGMNPMMMEAMAMQLGGGLRAGGAGGMGNMGMPQQIGPASTHVSQMQLQQMQQQLQMQMQQQQRHMQQLQQQQQSSTLPTQDAASTGRSGDDQVRQVVTQQQSTRRRSRSPSQERKPDLLEMTYEEYLEHYRRVKQRVAAEFQDGQEQRKEVPKQRQVVPQPQRRAQPAPQQQPQQLKQQQAPSTMPGAGASMMSGMGGGMMPGGGMMGAGNMGMMMQPGMHAGMGGMAGRMGNMGGMGMNPMAGMMGGASGMMMGGAGMGLHNSGQGMMGGMSGVNPAMMMMGGGGGGAMQQSQGGQPYTESQYVALTINHYKSQGQQPPHEDFIRQYYKNMRQQFDGGR